MLKIIWSKGLWFNIGLVLTFLIVVGSNIFSIAKLQNSIDSAQTQSVIGRQQNKERQDDLKAYIKCILLIRFDHPELSSPTVTKVQVSKALDACAAKGAQP